MNHFKKIKKQIKIVILFWIILAAGINTQAQTLTLEQCIDSALLHNRNIRISQQDINLAGERSKEVKSNLLPKLNAMADYRYYTDLPYQLMPAASFGGTPGTYKEVQFGVPQNLNASLQFTMPLYNPTALSAIKTAKAAGELSEIQKIKTEEDAVIDVSNAYYNAQILLNQLSFLDRNIINTGKLLQTTTLLHQQQLAKGTDVDRIRLQQQQLTTQRSTISSQHQQVLNALKFLMGKSIPDSIEVQLSAKTLIATDFHSHITTDMLLINKKTELNNTELKGLKNSRLPSWSAYGVYGSNGFGKSGDNSFFNFHPIGYLGTQLSIPLFNGTTTQHKIAQKKIEIEKTNIQQEVVNEKNKLDQANAEMQYALAHKTIETVNSQIELAAKIYDNTVLQNKQGMANITDLLLADNALREAQQNYIVALISLRKAELEYKRVTGTLITLKN